MDGQIGRALCRREPSHSIEPVSYVSRSFGLEVRCGSHPEKLAHNLSLDHGNCDASPAKYAAIGLLAGYRFGDYAAGYRLGKLACDLIEGRGLTRFGAKTYLNVALLTPWTRPARESIEAAQRAFQMANEQGDPTFAAYALSTLSSRRLASGEQLDRVAREAAVLRYVLHSRESIMLDDAAPPSGAKSRRCLTRCKPGCGSRHSWCCPGRRDR